MARILLVEDDGLVRKSVHRALERAGHEVWEAAGPKTALSMLDCVNVDIVITDIYMPGMNGVELIKRLEARQNCRRVIAMTGGGVTRTSEDLLREAKAVGADLTIEKPFGPEKLLATVQDVLNLAAPIETATKGAGDA